MTRTLFAAAAALACSAVLAQTAPKPATKPAAPAGQGKTLSFGSGTGKVLTRDELRSCLSRQASLATRRDEAEQTRVALDADKQKLVADQEAIKGDRDKVESARGAVTALNDKYKAYADRVAAFNVRTQEVDKLNGYEGERARRQLETERSSLQKTQTDLEAERARLGDGVQSTVDAYNTRAAELDKRVADWNQRNAAQTEKSRAVNSDRDSWAGECADRRYREDDEIAIRKGE